MKTKDVKIGGHYQVKVSGKLTRVRLTGENPHGGWDAVNTETNRTVRIKSVRRLRQEVSAGIVKRTRAEMVADMRAGKPIKPTEEERALAEATSNKVGLQNTPWAGEKCDWQTRFTTAPADYDGFGTLDCGVVGYDCGKPIRQVGIKPAHLEWQEARYGSGMHACLTKEKWEDALARGLATKVGETPNPAEPAATDANVGEPDVKIVPDPAPASEPGLDLTWSPPSHEETETSLQVTWLATPRPGFEYDHFKVVRTIPTTEGAGRPRYVPMYHTTGMWLPLESDRHGHCRGYQSLAKAVDEIEKFYCLQTGRVARILTSNATEIVLAAEQNGLAQINEEMEDMAKKTKTAPAEPNGKTAAPKASRKGAKKADGKMSAIDAAAKVLVGRKDVMTCQDMIKAMEEKGYWKSPGGKTPHATLYSAIIREIKVKGKESRFKKTEAGKFASA